VFESTKPDPSRHKRFLEYWRDLRPRSHTPCPSRTGGCRQPRGGSAGSFPWRHRGSMPRCGKGHRRRKRIPWQRAHGLPPPVPPTGCCSGRPNNPRRRDTTEQRDLRVQRRCGLVRKVAASKPFPFLAPVHSQKPKLFGIDRSLGRYEAPGHGRSGRRRPNRRHACPLRESRQIPPSRGCHPHEPNGYFHGSVETRLKCSATSVPRKAWARLASNDPIPLPCPNNPRCPHIGVDLRR